MKMQARTILSALPVTLLYTTTMVQSYSCNCPTLPTCSECIAVDGCAYDFTASQCVFLNVNLTNNASNGGTALTSLVLGNGTSASCPVREATMTWESWAALFTVITVLASLMLEIVGCTAALIMAGFFLLCCGIISPTELFAGLSNSGVLSLALMFVPVGPVSRLPAVKTLFRWAMRSSNERWSRWKLCLLCMVTSSFFNNTPQITVMLPMVINFCGELGFSPQQFVMPMAFAVQVGNYCIIGSSTNLVVDGLMRQAGMEPMGTYEIGKVNLPSMIPMLIYLTLSPGYLLPGHLKASDLIKPEEDDTVLHQGTFEVDKDSPILGFSMDRVRTLVDSRVEVSFDATTTEGNLVQPNSLIKMVGPRSCLHVHAVLNAKQLDAADPKTKKEMTPIFASPSGLVGSSTALVHDIHPESPPTASPMTPLPPVGNISQIQELATMTTNSEPSGYGATQPPSTPNRDPGEDCEDEPHTSGNSLLGPRLAFPSEPAVPQPEWYSKPDDFNLTKYIFDHFCAMPVLPCCCKEWGMVFTRKTDKGSVEKKRLVRTPKYYAYNALLIFVLMITVAATSRISLPVCALGAAILLVIFGHTTTKDAIKSIDLEVYIMTAFSFALGAGMNNSGLSMVVGELVRHADLNGVTLLFLISLITSLATNLVTNKAAAQVLFPVIHAVYTARGQSPLPGVMVMTAIASLALSTPYGLGTNVLIMRRAKYLPTAFPKFGIPLNAIGLICVPLTAAVVYNEW